MAGCSASNGQHFPAPQCASSYPASFFIVARNFSNESFDGTFELHYKSGQAGFDQAGSFSVVPKDAERLFDTPLIADNGTLELVVHPSGLPRASATWDIVPGCSPEVKMVVLDVDGLSFDEMYARL